MKKCCENQSTAYCPGCGANLKTRSLLGLVEDLQRRIGKAQQTKQKWTNADGVCDKEGADRKHAKQGIARTEETIERLTTWLHLLKAKMAAPQLDRKHI